MTLPDNLVEAFGLHTLNANHLRRGVSMMAVLFILVGYAIVPVLVLIMKSESFKETGRNRLPAVEII